MNKAKLGLHLDHRLSHRSSHGPVSHLSGPAGEFGGGHSRLRASRAHQPRSLEQFFPLRRAYAYDVRGQTQDRFVAEMTERLKIEIVGVASAEEAVRSADIVVTSGPILKDPEPTIPAAWIRPGTFASAVDFDSYWSAEALASFERIATDDHLQFAYYRETVYFRSTPTPYADLGELVSGVRPGRESTQEKTLAVNLGVALEDIAVAARLYELALERGIGTRLEL